MRRFILLFIGVPLLGCSSVDFSVASADGEAIETSIDEVSADALTDAGAEAPFDATGDATEDSADDCVPNSCGGCGPLMGEVGGKCGECGKWVCAKGGSKLECDDPKRNACGGCSILGAKPGDPCPSCGGVMKCNGTDALICEGTMPKNACGGCASLPVAPGTACGRCGSGVQKCSGTDAVVCDDPEASKPAVGTKCGLCGGATFECVGGAVKCNDAVVETPGKPCGTCGTSKFVCNSAGTATYCQTPMDTNACGGCKALTAAPTTPCGACTAGKYVCEGVDAVKCAEASFTPAAPGTACGTCGTSSYICDVGTTTKCGSPDDRKTAYDFDAAPSSTYTAFAPYWSAYTTSRTNATLMSVAYYLRYRAMSVSCPGTATSCPSGCIRDCSAGPCTCKPEPGYLADGPLELQLRSGSAGGPVVATSTINSNMVPTMGGWVTFSSWTPAAPTVTAGATYYLALATKAGDGIKIDAADSPTGLVTEYFLSGTPKIAARIQLRACGF